MRRDGFGDRDVQRVAVALDVASAALDAHAHATHATVGEVHAVELRAHGSTPTRCTITPTDDTECALPWQSWQSGTVATPPRDRGTTWC
jgi:hypothetical protein